MTKHDTLVLDAAPLLTGTASALQPLAEHFSTTSDVLGEIRDKTSRDLLANSQLSLRVQEPSSDAMLKVTNFARQTGDLAVLSHTDLRICALALTVEMQLNGLDRIRPALGQLSPAEARQKARTDQRRARRQAKKAASVQPQQQPKESTESSESAAAAPPDTQPADEGDDDEEGGWEQVPTRSAKKESADSDSDAGEWITPDNIKQHKAKALGLNPTQVVSEHAQAGGEPSHQPQSEPTTIRECACLTGDYAMQNVLMQMGLTALGPDGLQVKQVRTWVLRCHACFKLCKNPTEKFCPSCGNATLTRTSITYLDTPTPEHPQGYILHLKKNYQYHNRGTVYSLPSPQSVGGSAKGPKEQVVILRADQKEYLRGKKAYDVGKRKEERKAQKELISDSTGEQRLQDEWVPTLEMSEQTRNKHTRSHQTNSIRTDKAGMPLVGMKGNPNAVRRKRA